MSEGQPMVLLDNVSVHSGAFMIDAVNMEIPAGECVSLMGKSGSGKSTIMEAICGLRTVYGGKITINGEDVTHALPAARNIGLVPQDNVLFPTMTVRENLAYACVLKKNSTLTESDIKSRVEEVAESLGIIYLLGRKPKPGSLSGGEAKRVAIGRAITAKPKLLCLDESFTGLDDQTQSEVIRLVKETIYNEGVSTLLITHRQSEADALASMHYHLNEGKLSTIS